MSGRCCCNLIRTARRAMSIFILSANFKYNEDSGLLIRRSINANRYCSLRIIAPICVRISGEIAARCNKHPDFMHAPDVKSREYHILNCSSYVFRDVYMGSAYIYSHESARNSRGI